MPPPDRRGIDCCAASAAGLGVAVVALEYSVAIDRAPLECSGRRYLELHRSASIRRRAPFDVSSLR